MDVNIEVLKLRAIPMQGCSLKMNVVKLSCFLHSCIGICVCIDALLVICEGKSLEEAKPKSHDRKFT